MKDNFLSFQMPKLSFLLPECGEKAGHFHLLDIGILPSYLKKIKNGLLKNLQEKRNALGGILIVLCFAVDRSL